jgi:hypothetical protein
LEEGDKVSDFSGLSDHHAHPMVDEKSIPDPRSWMNFNPGQPASHLRDESRDKGHTVNVEPVGDTIGHQGVKPGIREDDLQRTRSSRIAIEYSG